MRPVAPATSARQSFAISSHSPTDSDGAGKETAAQPVAAGETSVLRARGRSPDALAEALRSAFGDDKEKLLAIAKRLNRKLGEAVAAAENADAAAHLIAHWTHRGWRELRVLDAALAEKPQSEHLIEARQRWLRRLNRQTIYLAGVFGIAIALFALSRWLDDRGQYADLRVRVDGIGGCSGVMYVNENWFTEIEDDGTFLMLVPRPRAGDLEFVLRSGRQVRQTWRLPFERVRTRALVGGELVLPLDEPCLARAVVVVRRASGEPVTDSRATILDCGSSARPTSNPGEFEFPQVEPGCWQQPGELSVVAEGNRYCFWLLRLYPRISLVIDAPVSRVPGPVIVRGQPFASRLTNVQIGPSPCRAAAGQGADAH